MRRHDKERGAARHLHSAPLPRGKQAPLADVQAGHRCGCLEAVHRPERAHVPHLQPRMFRATAHTHSQPCQRACTAHRGRLQLPCTRQGAGLLWDCTLTQLSVPAVTSWWPVASTARAVRGPCPAHNGSRCCLLHWCVQASWHEVARQTSCARGWHTSHGRQQRQACSASLIEDCAGAGLAWWQSIFTAAWGRLGVHMWTVPFAWPVSRTPFQGFCRKTLHGPCRIRCCATTCPVVVSCTGSACLPAAHAREHRPRGARGCSIQTAQRNKPADRRLPRSAGGAGPPAQGEREPDSAGCQARPQTRGGSDTAGTPGAWDWCAPGHRRSLEALGCRRCSCALSWAVPRLGTA